MMTMRVARPLALAAMVALGAAAWRGTALAQAEPIVGNPGEPILGICATPGMPWQETDYCRGPDAGSFLPAVAFIAAVGWGVIGVGMFLGAMRNEDEADAKAGRERGGNRS